MHLPPSFDHFPYPRKTVVFIAMRTGVIQGVALHGSFRILQVNTASATTTATTIHASESAGQEHNRCTVPL